MTSAVPTYTVMPDYGMGPYAWLQRPPFGRHHGVGGDCGESAGWHGDHPIPEDLHLAFVRWVTVFQNAPAHPTDSDAIVLDWPAFHAEGLALARRLKRAVGDRARVVYEKPIEDPEQRREARREIALDGALIALPGRAEIFQIGVFRLLRKIVSGGQTGVDRAALDWAIENAIPHGGWCTPDRKAEDGTIPDRYVLQPIATGGYRQRTRQNVQDSDGTLVLNSGALEGGTRQTLDFALALGKPYLLLDLDLHSTNMNATFALQWLRREPVRVLNVAGPREGKRPGIGVKAGAVFSAMAALSEMTDPQTVRLAPDGTYRVAGLATSLRLGQAVDQHDGDG